MPRKLLVRSKEFPYHLTARSNNKECFPISADLLWKLATNELYLLHQLYEIEVHAFVLMPNHFHLLLSTPEHDLGEVMRDFMRNLTKKINGYSARSGHVFGGPYFWSMVTSTLYFAHVLKYVYRNPVKAHLVNRIEEYEFSTARGIFGLGKLPLPIHFTRIGLETNLPDISKLNLWLDWLNKPFPLEAEKLIQKSLRKREIKELINRGSRKPYDELSKLI